MSASAAGSAFAPIQPSALAAPARALAFSSLIDACSAFVDRLEDAEIRMILLHEAAHLAERDQWGVLLQCVEEPQAQHTIDITLSQAFTTKSSSRTGSPVP